MAPLVCRERADVALRRVGMQNLLGHSIAHYFGGKAAALGMHERLADLLLLAFALGMDDSGASPRNKGGKETVLSVAKSNARVRLTRGTLHFLPQSLPVFHGSSSHEFAIEGCKRNEGGCCRWSGPNALRSAGVMH